MPESGSLLLPEEVLSDIDWWVTGLQQFNGRANVIVESDWIFSAVIRMGNWFVCGVSDSIPTLYQRTVLLKICLCNVGCKRTPASGKV